MQICSSIHVDAGTVRSEDAAHLPTVFLKIVGMNPVLLGPVVYADALFILHTLSQFGFTNSLHITLLYRPTHLSSLAKWK